MPKVTFLNETTTVEAKSGQTIKEVATEHGIPLHRGLWTWLNCRSHGLCGSCEVWVTELAPKATSAKGFREKIRGKVKGKVRLACQAQVLGDIEVRTLPGGLMFEPKQTLQWEQDPRPSAWKDRLAKANAGAAEDDEEGDAKKAKPAAPAAKPAAAASGGAPKPAAAAAPAAAATPAAAAAPAAAATPAAAAAPKATTTPPPAAAAPKPTTTPPATAAAAPKPTTTPPATSNTPTTPQKP